MLNTEEVETKKKGAGGMHIVTTTLLKLIEATNTIFPNTFQNLIMSMERVLMTHHEFIFNSNKCCSMKS